MILSLIAAGLLLGSCDDENTVPQEKYNQIADGFITPADTNKLWTYYYWIGDDISEEGITKDLEAMQEFGVGTVLIGNINPDEIDGPVPLFSDEWWSAMVHVVEEGHRLGIDVGMFNCPGWSQSGGPWVTADKAMRHLVYSETTVKGAKVNVELKRPAVEFQDTHVLAFKKIAEENKSITKTNVIFDIEKSKKYEVDLVAKDNKTVRSLILKPAEGNMYATVELFATVDGSMKSIKKIDYNRANNWNQVGPVVYGAVSVDLPETTASEFKLVCTDINSAASPVSGPSTKVGFAEIKLSEAVVLQDYVEKSLGKMHHTPLPEFDTYLWKSQKEPTDKDLLVADVIDLSEKLNSEGKLVAELPEGEWTILRMGMTPTGTKNSPAAPQGKGYEIDKANIELTQFHFDSYMKKIIERVPEESRSALKYVIMDSYEMGSQNWTDDMGAKFQEKYGYSAIKYLPVFSGRVVGSVGESDRFLWDLRRMVADEIAYKYVGGLSKAAHKYGMKVWLENYGHWGYPGEFMMYGGQSDLVSGEFWNEGELGNIENKTASSTAHMYGKPITSAEAFTAAFNSYGRHPAMLKRRGDWSYTEGINHYVLHLYIQQPRDKAPGKNAWFSTEFNRLNTWYDQGKAWADYTRRNQHMLQQGTYAADIMYFIGEDAPKMSGTAPDMPEGYSYDYVNAEVIMDRMTINDGKFTLPDGLQYSLLVFPEGITMRPEVLAKIEELVKAGGTVLGAKPSEKSPSLENFPECDEVSKELVGRMWGNAEGKLKKEHGKGRILDGISVKEALDIVGVEEDILVKESNSVLWTHRKMEGMQIYFITNQSEDVITINPSFNVSGLKPQLWDAVKGEIRKLNDFTDNGKRTKLSLTLQKHESCFVVFSNKYNENVKEGYIQNSPEYKVAKTLDQSWKVDFENKVFGPKEELTFDKLIDWTKFDKDELKYYSGTATYKTTFSIDELPKGDAFVNLGKVGVMARVKLNGKELGTTWIAPYRLNAKDALVKGENTLEIEVVNLWRNRLIGDEYLPKEERFTEITVTDTEQEQNRKLIPSGLVGPVTIENIVK